MRIKLDGAVTGYGIQQGIEQAISDLHMAGIEGSTHIYLMLYDKASKQIILPQILATKTLVIKSDADSRRPAEAYLQSPAVPPCHKPKGEWGIIDPRPEYPVTNDIRRSNERLIAKTRLVSNYCPTQLSNGLNKIVDDVWAELKPTHIRRPRIGEAVGNNRMDGSR